MKRQGEPIVLLGCLLNAGPMITTAEAASPARATTITVKMDNDNCAQRITTSLRELPNVGEARSDVAQRRATATPAGLRSPSARAFWGAVEKIRHAVAPLQGPQGKFISQPKP